ncbi:pyridoxal phosphate (PLP) phosphatase [Salmonella enterica subsp. enterica serovar Paratyphi B str. ATCC 51962]|nr:pyridoxal phosphate (PLP) phosphatase [Salmonella enterica subsp. enterica serovar Paratyphi B str. ATCC 51962]
MPTDGIITLNLEKIMTSRVIALDLDGTLLTPHKTLLPSSLDALSRAKEAGFQLIIVTGRHHVAIHPFYQALALETPAICCNGTYLYDYQAKTVLDADPMPVDKALQLIDLLDEHQIHGLMYVDDAMLYEHPTGHVVRTSRWAQTLPPEQRPTFTQVSSLAQAARDVNAVWKFALTDEDIPRLQRFGQHVEQALGLECEWSWHDQVDIARKGNSKGKRLTQWIEAQGGSMKNVIAFGDNYNDISMLEAAGTGVAMGNADEAVKARADVVIGDNTTDSIAKFIYTHLL